jgi:hypothetical protein
LYSCQTIWCKNIKLNFVTKWHDVMQNAWFYPLPLVFLTRSGIHACSLCKKKISYTIQTSTVLKHHTLGSNALWCPTPQCVILRIALWGPTHFGVKLRNWPQNALICYISTHVRFLRFWRCHLSSDLFFICNIEIFEVEFKMAVDGLFNA